MRGPTPHDQNTFKLKHVVEKWAYWSSLYKNTYNKRKIPLLICSHKASFYAHWKLQWKLNLSIQFCKNLDFLRICLCKASNCENILCVFYCSKYEILKIYFAISQLFKGWKTLKKIRDIIIILIIHVILPELVWPVCQGVS